MTEFELDSQHPESKCFVTGLGKRFDKFNRRKGLPSVPRVETSLWSNPDSVYSPQLRAPLDWADQLPSKVVSSYL